jgi:hypothetical protein
VVFFPIALCHLLAFCAEELLECGIHHQLLAYGVASEFPSELIAKAFLKIIVVAVYDLVVVLL